MTSATTRVRRADRTIVGAFQITNMGKLVAVAVKCSPSQSATLAREAARQGFVLISNGFSKETGAEILCFRPIVRGAKLIVDVIIEAFQVAFGPVIIEPVAA